MKRRVLTLVGVLATSLWSVANATSVTYSFSGSTNSNSSGGTTESGNAGGMVFTTSPQSFGSPAITIYGETAPNGLTGGADDGGPSTFGGTTGLFEVNNNGTNTATGIGPYFSNQASGRSGSLDLTGENGITETDVLLVNLSGVTAGSTVSFVMATGVNAADNTGINVWDGVQSVTPTGMGAGQGANPLANEAITGGNVNGPGGGSATQTFNISGTVGTGAGQYDWIAIQADCHYLLLQSLTVYSPTGVPEPSFYGFFALAMVGLVIGARKMRARTAVAVAEKA